MVDELRKKLLNSIIKYGMVDQRTYEISQELDNEINEYYKKVQKNEKKYCKKKN